LLPALPNYFFHFLFAFPNGQSGMQNYIPECTPFIGFWNGQFERLKKHYGDSAGSNSPPKNPLELPTTRQPNGP